MTLPISVTAAGPQPTPPQVLLANLIALVAAEVPGYTASLPAALITDLASTATGALTLIDQAFVDLVNSVSPYAANVKLTQSLGAIYGVPQGVGSNTSVYVVFTGPVGFVIPKGFLVSDGNNQYAVQNLITIPTGGVTAPVYCLAINSGSWAVPAGTVTMMVTSVPSTITLTCINPINGLAGLAGQSVTDYRAQVVQAGMFTVQGSPDAFKTATQKISGVQNRLVSYRQVSTTQWVAIVGGGDPYSVAQAIYESVPDISKLTTAVVDQYGNTPASVTVSISDYPDTYSVGYITPDSEMVNIILTWNTSASNYIDPAAVDNASITNIVNYVNSVYVGQPINTYTLEQIFVSSLASIIQPELISLITIEVGINGVIVPPNTNTGLVFGGEYSYFTTDATHVTVQQYV